MVKVCEVPGCESGRYQERTQRFALGLRQRALFRTPKCKDRLSEWKRALDCNLEIGKFVCELHFREKHIKKYNKTVLSNGDVHVMPLTVWHLTHNAIPISRSQDSANVDSANESGEDNTPASVSEKESHHGRTKSDDTVSKVLPSTVAAKETVAIKSRMAPTVFTMDLLQNELSTALLPESWAWTCQASKKIFTLLDPSSLCPRLHLEIADDLSLQIRTNAGVSIPLNENAKSMADIRTHLKILEKMPICSGTGMNSEKRHRDCAGFLEADQIPKRTQRMPRCTFCKQLRHGIQKRIRRRRESSRQRLYDN